MHSSGNSGISVDGGYIMVCVLMATSRMLTVRLIHGLNVFAFQVGFDFGQKWVSKVGIKSNLKIEL